MKDKIFGILQRVGRSFMLPIAILPVAGLFLGIGGSLTNETMLKAYGLMGIMGPGTPMNAFLSVLNDAGSIVFANLPLLFAMGVAIGMAKKEKDVAALSGAIAFLIMHASIGAMININGGTEAMLSGSTADVLGITSLQMGVFGGMIVGLGVAALHNRFYKIELPQVLSFFGGTRFVPIISAITYVFVGIAMFYIWQPIQGFIYSVGNLVQISGYAGTWLYGFMERALIPFGLHHVFYLPFWQTAVGGTAMVGGHLVEGAQNIFFSELATPGITHFSVDATRFMAGKFPLMIFGLSGAALAIYKCAKTEKRKVVGGLLLSAALTAMLTGITEPIEFTFLFVAPILYAIHSVLAGVAYMLMHILNVGVGMTFSGGLIDLTLFGIMQGNLKTHWINIIWVGLIYFAGYYFLFSFLIKKFDLQTPGRDDTEEVKLYTKSDLNAKNKVETVNQKDQVSALILKGLGGADNLSDVDCCATRLRITVKDSSKVSEELLKSSGAAGVIVKGNGVQVVYGPKVTVIKANLEEFIASGVKIDIDEDISVEENKEIKEEDKEIRKEIEEEVNNENTYLILAPIEGNAIDLSEVGDGVFSEGILGKGVAIQPSIGRAVSPLNGTISTVFDTKHAVGLTSDDGVEVLIHIGLDTVKLNGEHFNAHVKAGDKVKAGDLLVEFDIEKIKEAGYPTVTPIVITNTDSYSDIEVVVKGKVKEKDKLVSIR